MKYATKEDQARTLHFFRDRPLAQALFEQVSKYVDSVGTTELVSTKSRVAWVRNTRFLWIHEATKDGIWLAFLLEKELSSPRVRTGATGRRFSHHLKVTGLDLEITSWIKLAYTHDAG